jgi:glycerol-3-phosphate dehydrogenase
MAEDCVNQAAILAQLPDKPCLTGHLNIHGAHHDSGRFGHRYVYGSDAPAIEALAQADHELAKPLHPALRYTEAEVVWAVRFEMARTVEDVLARRLRALFLNARAALAMAPRVAAMMAQELHRDDAWETGQVQAFHDIARNYMLIG